MKLTFTRYELATHPRVTIDMHSFQLEATQSGKNAAIHILHNKHRYCVHMSRLVQIHYLFLTGKQVKEIYDKAIGAIYILLKTNPAEIDIDRILNDVIQQSLDAIEEKIVKVDFSYIKNELYKQECADCLREVIH